MRRTDEVYLDVDSSLLGLNILSRTVVLGGSRESQFRLKHGSSNLCVSLLRSGSRGRDKIQLIENVGNYRRQGSIQRTCKPSHRFVWLLLARRAGVSLEP